MVTIRSIEDRYLKSKITSDILTTLPEWFGIEESINEYILGVKDSLYYLILKDDKYIGFFSIKIVNKVTAELYVNGIVKEYHRKGIGGYSIKYIEDSLRSRGIKILIVKTVGEGLNNIPYKNTRRYYTKVGFLPLEEIVGIWGDIPCLIMIKSLI